MELWTNVLSLLVLQIVIAQEDYCPQEYLPPWPEFSPYLPSVPTPEYLPPVLPNVPGGYSLPLPYLPECLPPLPAQNVLPPLPALPDINLSLPVTDGEECYEPIPPSIPLAYPPPYSTPAYPYAEGYPYNPPEYEKSKCSLLENGGKLFKKCLEKKLAKLNKIVGALHKPSSVDKCAHCNKGIGSIEYPEYEGYRPPYSGIFPMC